MLKTGMQKPHKNGVLAYLGFYCCYDFLVVMTYGLKPRVG
ncbi:putative membrane protein [Acinetobacter sp. 723929]|nr:putative membrane protein [Acinetobacter sp. 1475718]EXI16559.1 putative membrane protein [Acinetobacter sp. 723929]EXS01628.1 putative membrane protein [Acinetobacter sp. 225588]EYT43897.1 putative membrane protein [Acinetobacter sp. 478810]KCX92309.1 putative membrane protein [Acinetobacter sp. 72431]